LPKFNDKGWVYGYVCYIADDICLCLITADNEDFYPLREHKAKIVAQLNTKGVLADVQKVMSTVQASQRAVGVVQAQMDELDAGVPELRFILYRSEPLSQFITFGPLPPFSLTARTRTQLFRRLQHVHSRMSDGRKRHSIYYEVGEFASLLGWVRAGEFEMFAVFSPLVSKEHAITACNRALRWFKREESSLFIGNVPIFA